jgi:hypothetical protein
VPALAIAAATTPTLIASPTAARAQDPGRLCARFGEVVETGAIAAAELLETSGMVSSREHGGVLYAHNDAGGGAVVFAMDETGTDLGPYSVVGAEPGDWEDIAVGPMPRDGRSALYIGDIGDNQVRRNSVTVVRVAEPQLRPDGGGGELGPVDVLRFTYPNGAVDAEALIVDPRSGDLVIVASPADSAPRIYWAPGSELVAGETITLTDGGEVDGAAGAAVTAGDISPDGSFILLRTTDAVLAFERGDEPIAETLTTTPCQAPSADEPSPQAIAIVGDGSAYITASEVAGAINRGDLPPGSASRLYRVSIAAPGEEAPTTSAPQSTTTTAAPPASTTAPSSTTASADTTTPGTAAPETTVPGTAAPDEPGTTDAASSPDDSPAPVPGDDDGGLVGPSPGDDDGGGDGGGLPLWIAALVVIRRRRHAPLPGSAPLGPPGTDPFAPPTAGTAPTEQLPVTPPPTPGSMPPPDAGGRLG